MAEPQHVMPLNDVVEHRASDDCVCGPTTEHVAREEFEDLDDAMCHILLELRSDVEGTAADCVDQQLVIDLGQLREEFRRLVEVPFRKELGDPTYEPVYVEIVAA